MAYVIIEGPDGAGKTTLAKKLSEKYNALIRHFGPPTKDPFLEYYETAIHYNEDERLIFDRFHLGEYVYGTMFRDGCRISPIMFSALDYTLAERGAILVLLNPDPSFMDENLVQREADGETDPRGFEQREAQKEIRELFFEAFENSWLPKIMIDPTSDIQVENLFAAIKFFVPSFAEAATVGVGATHE